jgi:glycosyltransferase involved in cell wall biosynthesis
MMASNLFLFPTLYEGGATLSLLDAMQFGLPVVVSSVGGISEVIENKVHGVMFRKGDGCAILMALQWALDHPDEMKRMAENSALRVKDFSNAKMVDKTLGVLKDLAAGTAK